MNKQVIIVVGICIILVGILTFAVVEKPQNKNFEQAGETLKSSP
jgi:hypothetical protein